MSGVDRLQKRFDSMDGRTVRDNTDLDALVHDSDDGVPIVLLETRDTIPEDDDLSAYYYLMNEGPFLNQQCNDLTKPFIFQEYYNEPLYKE